MKKLLSIFLSAAIMLSCFGTVSFADDEFVIESLEEYVVYETELASDGYLGIPVGIKTYASGNTTSDSSIIYYVVNTNTERVGTDTDEQILTDLINRNYLVTVSDYKNNSKANDPYSLDWSIYKVLDQAVTGWRGGAQANTESRIVLPAGYNVTTDEVFFELDKHGADGSFQRIIDVWNNDFLGTKGSTSITLADGTKTTVAAYTASLPGGVASDITQLIKKDGTPIDLDLKMDIIYPTNPENEVPVMVHASSAEARANPLEWRMNAFTLDGYAGVSFDYTWVPMARKDHYGYFDGNDSGSVTGDNNSYSMGMYSGVKAETAVIRKIRYLSDREHDKYKFNVDKIGVFGVSKAGLVTRLGNPNPENYPEERFLPGHHGETRFENGDTEDREFTVGDNTYTIDGGEQQPWLTYSNGDPIPSNVQFVYSTSGGAVNSITEG